MIPPPKTKGTSTFLRADLPISTSSRIYLIDELARWGVMAIPAEGAQELADDAVRQCIALAKLKGRHWQDDVANLLVRQAANVAYLLKDERDSNGKQIIEGPERESLAAILTRHGVRVPPSL